MTLQLLPVAAVTGTDRPAGAELREVFSRALARSAGGAQLVVSRRGELLADLAGGGIELETPVQVFSVSKLVVALAAAHAHAAGVLDLDAPLADCWPASRPPRDPHHHCADGPRPQLRDPCRLPAADRRGPA